MYRLEASDLKKDKQKNKTKPKQQQQKKQPQQQNMLSRDLSLTEDASFLKSSCENLILM